jgi:competence protein ComEC
LIALPLSLFFFKRYSFAGFFAGLVLLPLTAVITAGGILLIPLAPLSGGLSNLLLTVLDIPLHLFFHIVEFFSGAAGFFTIFRASPSILSVVLVLVSFYLLSVSRARVYKIILNLVIVVGIVYMSVNIFYYRPGNLEVFYLDVGQGDSEVVVFPGGDALLIDGGGNYYSDFPVGQRIVLPFLLQKRIRVKWAAVSHFHPDHAGGVAEILPIIKPGELWISSEAEGDIFYKQLIRAVPGSVVIKKLQAPFTKKIGQCTIEFLYPDQWIKAYRSHNNHSQVFKISDHHHSFLFTGDIEEEVESRLKEADCSKLRASVLKVPHHGSRTSSTFDFLECIDPGLAIFSYSKGNRFNFPHKEVVGNYKTLGIPYLTTARSGGIRVISFPGSLKIETSK